MIVRLFTCLLPVSFLSCSGLEAPTEISVYLDESSPQTEYTLANAGSLFDMVGFERATFAASADIIV